APSLRAGAPVLTAGAAATDEIGAPGAPGGLTSLAAATSQPRIVLSPPWLSPPALASLVPSRENARNEAPRELSAARMRSFFPLSTSHKSIRPASRTTARILPLGEKLTRIL